MHLLMRMGLWGSNAIVAGVTDTQPSRGGAGCRRSRPSSPPESPNYGGGNPGSYVEPFGGGDLPVPTQVSPPTSASGGNSHRWPIVGLNLCDEIPIISPLGGLIGMAASDEGCVEFGTDRLSCSAGTGLSRLPRASTSLPDGRMMCR